MATSTAIARVRKTIPSTLKFSTFNYNTAATHAVLAAVTGKYLRIWLIRWTAAGTVTVDFKNGSTTLCDTLHCITGVQYERNATLFLPSPNRAAAFAPLSCDISTAFNMTLGGAVLVAGEVWYEETSYANDTNDVENRPGTL